MMMIRGRTRNRIDLGGLFKKLSITLLSLQINLSESFEDHPPPHSTQVIHNRQIKGSTEVTIPIKGHTIYPPFVDTDLQNRWFDFGGSAIIDTNRHVRLTQNRASEAGYLWSRYPLTQPSFQVEVEFKIDGDSASLYGDGMAVWFSKPSQQIGPVFGSADHWDGFGIMIDTFPNARHSYAFPRILGMINHGYTSFDVGTDGDGQEAGACSYSVRRSDVSTKLQINYVRGRFLELLVQHDKWDEWDHCFTVSNYTLPENIFLGFSAHTGEVSDAHDILSVATNGLVYHPPRTANTGSKSSTHHDWNGNIGGGIGSGALGFWGSLGAYLFLATKWSLIFACVGLALFGGKKYFAKYQQGAMKKF
ncbi:hypothetical protein Pst134EA_022746 [Puccinia striiformis f. sp. tritici]|uniref:hypothetical protein n=1 Tax=Puccinia striiformis f. sp. tritici TaxID=168172 RepID=UPI00200840A0|nr:hypothetical protein Pst134EA_022746 [Puccinia striiformis f. sp. tritici]KAH9455271.1 hypothetical protein Pst134EA_022746 [Puccinia striiformis f. sp. tritici]KAI9612231.1 hypothetical protein KEM48_004247 [Puccinia striiformis f. sp. tritici PST-130]